MRHDDSIWNEFKIKSPVSLWLLFVACKSGFLCGSYYDYSHANEGSLPDVYKEFPEDWWKRGSAKGTCVCPNDKPWYHKKTQDCKNSEPSISAGSGENRIAGQPIPLIIVGMGSFVWSAWKHLNMLTTHKLHFQCEF